MCSAARRSHSLFRFRFPKCQESQESWPHRASSLRNVLLLVVQHKQKPVTCARVHALFIAHAVRVHAMFNEHTLNEYAPRLWNGCHHINTQYLFFSKHHHNIATSATPLSPTRHVPSTHCVQLPHTCRSRAAAMLRTFRFARGFVADDEADDATDATDADE